MVLSNGQSLLSSSALWHFTQRTRCNVWLPTYQPHVGIWTRIRNEISGLSQCATKRGQICLKNILHFGTIRKLRIVPTQCLSGLACIVLLSKDLAPRRWQTNSMQVLTSGNYKTVANCQTIKLSNADVKSGPRHGIIFINFHALR